MTLLDNLRLEPNAKSSELSSEESELAIQASRAPLADTLERVEEILGYPIREGALTARYEALRARAATLLGNAAAELEADTSTGEVDGRILDAQARAWREQSCGN